MHFFLINYFSVLRGHGFDKKVKRAQPFDFPSILYSFTFQQRLNLEVLLKFCSLKLSISFYSVSDNASSKSCNNSVLKANEKCQNTELFSVRILPYLG